MDNAGKAKRITVISFITNCLLSAGKILIGIFGSSGALIADGIHSLSDLITDVIVFVGLRISQKPADEKHNYGHGKVEIVATVLVSVALFIAGFSIGRNGVEKLVGFIRGDALDNPALIAVVAAAMSLIIKEILFRQTLKTGKETGSEALIANAWHHRSDALSSFGVLLGAGGAWMLGSRFAFLDPAAQIIVSLFIFRAAYKILVPNLGQLADAAIAEEEINYIKRILEKNPGVLDYHHLRTRHVGSLHAVDVHILVNPGLDISKAHDISTAIEYEIKSILGADCFVSVHVEPYDKNQRI